MAKDLTNKQKREWACLLYQQDNITQKEIAFKVGVSEKTISDWKDKDNWDALRKSTLTMKSEILRGFYDILDKIRRKLKEEDGIGDAKLADMSIKYTAAIRNLETETSIAQLMEGGRLFINHLLNVDPLLAQKVLNEYDSFIKAKLKHF